MKAIVQEGFGSPDVLALREIERPAVADDAVRVRVHAASLNAFDRGLLRMRLVHVILRLMGKPPSRVRGGDLAGVVEACGLRVTRFKPGDEVFGVGRGTFAEYATTREERLAAKPRTLTFEQAAALPVAGCTALQGLRDAARVQAGESVLIYGAGGGTGTFAVQIARALGARVTAVTRTGHLERMRTIGAERVIDYTREDFTRGDARYDVIFDIGANRSIEDLRRVLTSDGRLVLVGAPARPAALLARLLATRITPRTRTFTAQATTPTLIALKELAEAGAIVPVIDRIWPLGEVPEAFRHFETGLAAGKIVIHVP